MSARYEIGSRLHKKQLHLQENILQYLVRIHKDADGGRNAAEDADYTRMLHGGIYEKTARTNETIRCRRANPRHGVPGY